MLRLRDSLAPWGPEWGQGISLAKRKEKGRAQFQHLLRTGKEGGVSLLSRKRDGDVAEFCSLGESGK